MTTLIGPIEVGLWDPSLSWTSSPTASGMRSMSIGLVCPWGKAKQFIELVDNADRQVTIGNETGVLEYLWTDDRFLRDFRGWCLLKSAGISPKREDSLGGDMAVVGVSVAGVCLGDRQVAVVRSARTKNNSFGLAGAEILAAPLTVSDGNPAFAAEPGGTVLEREFDAVHGDGLFDSIADDRTMQLRVGDVGSLATVVLPAVEDTGSPPAWIAERGGDCRVYDVSQAREVFGPSHPLEEPSDLVLENGLTRWWLGGRGIVPYFTVMTFVDGAWQQSGCVALTDETTGPQLDGARLVRVTPDRVTAALRVRGLGDVYVTLCRGERMLRIQHGSTREPTVAATRVVQWLGAPPTRDGIGDAASGVGEFGRGIVNGPIFQWPAAATRGSWSVRVAWLPTDDAGDLASSGLFTILDSDLNVAATVWFEAGTQLLHLEIGADDLPVSVDFSVGDVVTVEARFDTTAGAGLSVRTIDGVTNVFDSSLTTPATEAALWGLGLWAAPLSMIVEWGDGDWGDGTWGGVLPTSGVIDEAYVFAGLHSDTQVAVMLEQSAQLADVPADPRPVWYAAFDALAERQTSQSMAVFAPTPQLVRVVDTYAETDGLTWSANPSIAWFVDRYFLVFDGNDAGGTSEGQAGQTIFAKTSIDGVTWAAAVNPFHDALQATNPVTDAGIGFQPCLVNVGDELWCMWSQGTNVFISKLADPDGLWTNYRFEFDGRDVFLSSTVNGAATGSHSLFATFGGHSDWFPFSPTDPVVLSDGVVACPVTLRSSAADPSVLAGTPAGFFSDLKYNAVFFYDPGDDVWRMSDNVPPGAFPPASAWEPTVWEDADGVLWMYSRNDQTALPDNDTLLVAKSIDRQAWTTEVSAELVVPVSRPSTKRISGSRWLMAHDDYAHGDTGTPTTFSDVGRQNGTLFVSRRGVDDFAPGVGFSGDTVQQSYPQFCVHDDTIVVAFNDKADVGRHTVVAILDAPVGESTAFVYPRRRSEFDQAGPVLVDAAVDYWRFNGHRQATEAAAAAASADWSVAAWIKPDLLSGVVLDARTGAGDYSFVFTLDRVSLNSLNLFGPAADPTKPGLFCAAMDSANSKLVFRYAAADDTAFTTTEAVVRCLLFGSNPAEADTVTVDGFVFNFTSSPVTTVDVQIGATAAATAANLVTKLAANGFRASIQDNTARVFVARGDGTTFVVSSGTGAVTTPALSTVNMTPAAARVGYKNIAGSSLTGLYGDVYEVRQFTSLLSDNNLRYLFNQLASSLGGASMGGTATDPGAPAKLFDASSTTATFPDLAVAAPPTAVKVGATLELHGEASAAVEVPFAATAIELRFKFSATPTGAERWVIATFGTAAHYKQLYVDGSAPTHVLLDGVLVATIPDLTSSYSTVTVVVSGDRVRIGTVAVATGAHGDARLFLGPAHARPGLIATSKVITFDVANMTAGGGDLEDAATFGRRTEAAAGPSGLKRVVAALTAVSDHGSAGIESSTALTVLDAMAGLAGDDAGNTAAELHDQFAAQSEQETRIR